MAEAALFIVVKKLGAALGGEALKTVSSVLEEKASLLAQLPSSMNQIRREFIVMQAFLTHIDTSRSKNKTLKAWSDEVRKIAYAVEDTIDEYVHLMGMQMQRTSRGFSCSRIGNIIRRSPNVADLIGVATRLKHIEIELQHVSNMKERWVSMGDGGGAAGSSSSSSDYGGETQLQPAEISSSDYKIPSIEKNKSTLQNWLAEKKPNRTIISVWGMGGLGKTSLVTSVYRTEIKNFECHAWITVSQSYKAEKLLRTMIKEFFENIKEIPSGDINTMDVKKLVETLQTFLKKRRYLLVLDNVWDQKAYNDISKALDNDEQKGGTVVITTQVAQVASLAPEDRRLELKVLGEIEEWDLFCKGAFLNGACPQELENVARKIVRKCGGLPLAILSISRLLSRRENTTSEWEKVYNQLDWEFNNNPELDQVKHAFSLSFNYLPRDVKNCLLYCTVFPEGYPIQRKRLIRLWIAEGFVEERGRRTREEVGDDYFNELIHRCMLQVARRNVHLRRTKVYRIHNIVREFAVKTSRKERFTMVCDNPNALERFSDETRRLSVQSLSGNDGTRIQESIDIGHLPRLRTLMVFDPVLLSSSLLSSVLSGTRYLTVLVIDGVPVERLPDEVGNLFNLHYLGLRRTKVKELPESIAKLSNLQTLDLMYTDIVKLPNGVIKLKKLRHLLAEKDNDPTLRSFDAESGVTTPTKAWDFKELQTLRLVEATKSLVGRLRHLTRLGDLGICKVKGSHCAELCASISKMPTLSSLRFFANDVENETLKLEGLNPPPKHLEKLNLKGKLAEELDSPLFQAHGRTTSMSHLILGWSGLTKDPLPSLHSSMPDLTYLWLQNAYHGQLMQFREGWFPKLKTLVLGDMDQLDEVEIEKGAIKNLEYLELVGLKTMKQLPEGIEFLESLQVLWLRELDPKFGRNLQKTGDKDKIKHIPTVILISKIGRRLIQESL